MSHQQPNRREFFKKMILAAAAGAFADTLFKGTALAQPKLDYIDVTEKKRTDAANKTCVPAAKNLNYRDKAEELAKDIKAKKVKVTPATFKDKTGKDIPLETRTCDKCALFALQDPKLHTCAVIPGCLVQPKGACTSWSPKPGVV